MNLLLAEIAGCTGGRILYGTGREKVTSISTDTRSLKSGEMFLALDGENFDGHEFIGEAIGKDAAFLLVDKGRKIEAEIPTVLVDDTLTALGDIAHCWREKINPVVVAVTGSTGKTTTKDMVGNVISGEKPSLVTKGNLNNLVGLPLTLIRLEKDHEVAVVEFGMNVKGELSRLTEIAAPDIALMTNIGEAHIGKFGSEEALLEAKAEMFEALADDATVVVNRDCNRTAKILDRLDKGQNVVGFAVKTAADVMAKDIGSIMPFGYEFDLVIRDKKVKARLNMFGRHNVYNGLCAAAALERLGVPVEKIANGLERFSSGGMRSELEEIGGVLFVKDYYNANPTSMIEAARSVFDIKRSGRRWAILGDMLELGEFEEQMHKRVADELSVMAFDGIFTLGKRGKIIYQNLEHIKIKAHFSSVDEAVEEVGQKLKPDDIVLIKASRLMRLERVFEGLKNSLVNR